MSTCGCAPVCCVCIDSAQAAWFPFNYTGVLFKAQVTWYGGNFGSGLPLVWKAPSPQVTPQHSCTSWSSSLAVNPGWMQTYFRGFGPRWHLGQPRASHILGHWSASGVCFRYQDFKTHVILRHSHGWGIFRVLYAYFRSCLHWTTQYVHYRSALQSPQLLWDTSFPHS